MVVALQVNVYVISGRFWLTAHTKVVDFVLARSLEFEVVTADDNRIHRVIGDRRLDSSTFQEALALWAPVRRAHRQTAESGRLARAGPGANRCGRRCNAAGSLPWETFFFSFFCLEPPRWWSWWGNHKFDPKFFALPPCTHWILTISCLPT